VVATGYLSPEAVSVHLQACDAAVQPYPDGASGRRTTLMAALECAVPTVTTRGRFTEPLWDSAPVRLAPAGDAAALAAATLDLLDAPDRRALGTAGRDFYRQHFSMRRTLDVLLGE